MCGLVESVQLVGPSTTDRKCFPPNQASGGVGRLALRLPQMERNHGTIAGRGSVRGPSVSYAACMR
jgi:hypothetical protein